MASRTRKRMFSECSQSEGEGQGGSDEPVLAVDALDALLDDAPSEGDEEKDEAEGEEAEEEEGQQDNHIFPCTNVDDYVSM